MIKVNYDAMAKNEREFAELIDVSEFETIDEFEDALYQLAQEQADNDVIYYNDARNIVSNASYDEEAYAFDMINDQDGLRVNTMDDLYQQLAYLIRHHQYCDLISDIVDNCEEA